MDADASHSVAEELKIEHDAAISVPRGNTTHFLIYCLTGYAYDSFKTQRFDPR